MSSSDDSEDIEQRAITDKRVDDYFPWPIDSNDGLRHNGKGYRPITKAEEIKLLSQGIMTYYRGHTESLCCEVCDDALRQSDKYARGKEILQPVQVQKKKYIDKRSIDCEKYSNRPKVPTYLQTGKKVDLKKQTETEIRQNYKDSSHIDDLNLIYDILFDIGKNKTSAELVIDLVTLIIEGDLADLFFNSSKTISDAVGELSILVSLMIEDLRFLEFNILSFNKGQYEFVALAALAMVILQEFTKREVVGSHSIPLLIGIKNNYSYLSFEQMVKDLSDLPHYKETQRRPAKVKFNQFDSSDKKTNDEFVCKRKKMTFISKCHIKPPRQKFAQPHYEMSKDE